MDGADSIAFWSDRRLLRKSIFMKMAGNVVRLFKQHRVAARRDLLQAEAAAASSKPGSEAHRSMDTSEVRDVVGTYSSIGAPGSSALPLPTLVVAIPGIPIPHPGLPHILRLRLSTHSGVQYSWLSLTPLPPLPTHPSSTTTSTPSLPSFPRALPYDAPDNMLYPTTHNR